VLIFIAVKSKTLLVTTDGCDDRDWNRGDLVEPVQSYDAVYLWSKEG
jgi:hypothetical protein